MSTTLLIAHPDLKILTASLILYQWSDKITELILFLKPWIIGRGEQG